MDFVALGAAVLAASTTRWLFATVFRPMPPSALVPPRQGTGLLSLLGQHGYDIFVNEGIAAAYRSFKLFEFRALYVRVFYFHRILVGHPKDIEHVMILNSSNYVKGDDYKALIPILGEGLVTILDDERHSTHRRVINPAFSPSALKEIADTCMRIHALEMLTKLKADYEAAVSGTNAHLPFRTTVRSVVNRPALNIIADAAFHSGPSQVERVSGHFQKILSVGQALGVINIIPLIRDFPSPAKMQRAAALRELTTFLKKVTDTVRRDGAPAASGSEDAPTAAAFEGKAIIDYLVHSGSFTDHQMLDHSLTFIFAGHETSSNTIQWITLLLATNLAIQDRLYEELVSIMNVNSCPDISELQKCRYLSLVIKEGMRLYPVAPLIMRVPLQDDVLPYSKTVVPAGQNVTLNFFVAQRNPGIYGADADDFRPERWEDPTLADRVGTCGWMPFSVGKRNCIGKDFALNEITIILAVLIRNFRVVFPDGAAFPKRRVGITLTTREAYEVDMFAR